MYTLVVCNREGQVVQRVPIGKGEWLIGRQDGNHVVLVSTSVSRQHARIYTAQDRCFIQDLKSANGVVVGGQRINEVHEMRASEPVQVGDFTLILQLAGAEADPGASGLNTYIVTQDRSYPKLVGSGGPFDEQEFVLSERELTMGRTDDNFVLLPDPSVSRCHARIVSEDPSRHILFDLHSSNGTFVNRRRVQRALLRHGDIVTLGNINLRFVDPAGAKLKGGPGAGNLRWNLVVYGLVVLLLATTVGTVGVVVYRSWERKSAVAAREQSFRDSLKAGRSAVVKKRWDRAIEVLGSAEALDPMDRDVKKLLATARAEKGNHGLWKQADDLFLGGDLAQAMEVLQRIPSSSVYGRSVEQKLEDIRREIRQRLMQKVETACGGPKLLDCHALLGEVLNLEPGNSSALKRLRAVERRMARRRISFRRWSPEAAGAR